MVTFHEVGAQSNNCRHGRASTAFLQLPLTLRDTSCNNNQNKVCVSNIVPKDKVGAEHDDAGEQ